MTLADDFDWAESGVSPFRLVPWRQACSDLDCSGNTLLKLLAQHGIGVVSLSTRKRAVLARDLVKIIQANSKSAENYATLRGQRHG